MRIEKEKCITCGLCVPYCPVEAISMDDVAVIDQDECVDCGSCLRAGVCPVDCIVFEPAPWPRSLRVVFSDPTAVFKETGVPGRGTEEMKTNDVTGRFKRGWVGIALEFGRPGMGARFRDVDKAAQVLARLGAKFEPKNPVTFLMEDVNTGKIKDEVLNEKVLSAIIECLFPIEKLKDVLMALKKISKETTTVFSVPCICRADPDGSFPVEKILRELGVPYYINGKNNVGLGRPLAEGGD
jgi:NAD-dependent dihydropyrimidine dehydrogenase PreA subunit